MPWWACAGAGTCKTTLKGTGEVAVQVAGCKVEWAEWGPSRQPAVELTDALFLQVFMPRACRAFSSDLGPEMSSMS